jgi:hypothetical protein
LPHRGQRRSNGGGGIHAYTTNSVDSIRIGHCRIENNRAPGIENGGGVYLWHGRIHDSLLGFQLRLCRRRPLRQRRRRRALHRRGQRRHQRRRPLRLGLRVRNAVVWGNARSNLFRSGSGNVVEHCVVAPATAGEGNLAADPLFRIPPPATTA